MAEAHSNRSTVHAVRGHRSESVGGSFKPYRYRASSYAEDQPHPWDDLPQRITEAQRELAEHGPAPDQPLPPVRYFEPIKRPQGAATPTGGPVSGFMQRWKCDECDLVSNGSGLGTHQAHSKHSGRTKVGATPEPTPREEPTRAHDRRWRCDVCGTESTATGLGIHQRHAGHTGRTPAFENSPPTPDQMEN